MGRNSEKPENETSQLKASILAGFGGTLPTLSKLAAATTQNGNINIISSGHLTAICLYFVIATILCIGFVEKRRKEAFFLGIAAPAIITSILSGVSEKGLTKLQEELAFNILSTAYAQGTTGTEYTSSNSTSGFWNDFKRGLGFNVETAELENRLVSQQIKLNEQISLNTDIENEKYKLEIEVSDLTFELGSINTDLSSLRDEKNCGSELLNCKECPSPTIDANIIRNQECPEYEPTESDSKWNALVLSELSQIYSSLKRQNVESIELANIRNILFSEKNLRDDLSLDMLNRLKDEKNKLLATTDYPAIIDNVRNEGAGSSSSVCKAVFDILIDVDKWIYRNIEKQKNSHFYTLAMLLDSDLYIPSDGCFDYSSKYLLSLARRFDLIYR